MDYVEETQENPKMAETLMSDAVAFGGGAVVTNIALESVTAGYMAKQNEAGKTVEEIQKLGYMIGGGKVIGGLLTQVIAMKYVSNMWAKKLLYGVATGFYVSASSDVINAYAMTKASA